MLILERTIDQVIVIGGNIFVRVLEVQRNRVKFSVIAPVEVIILREEELERAGKDQAETRPKPDTTKGGHKIITRKVDQAFVIGSNIFVRVIGIDWGHVKIGISAPIEVVVLREELLEREEKIPSVPPPAKVAAEEGAKREVRPSPRWRRILRRIRGDKGRRGNTFP